jgi:23S rRNA U2552 (ribose-2'-O)-methylase RlmE/FtsJ
MYTKLDKIHITNYDTSENKDNQIFTDTSHLFTDMKSNIDIIKNKQEPLKNNNGLYNKNTRFYEASLYIVKHVRFILNDKRVSNAWLKYYEICMEMKLLALLPNENKYTPVVFFNGELPGSGILATWHLVNTIFKKYLPNKISWYASSYINNKNIKVQKNGQKHVNTLEDRYGLVKKYPNNWLFGPANGDVTNIESHLYWEKCMGKKVDLYFSDAAADVSSDYNNQESLHSEINIGQILAGLIMLKKGGNMVFKQYSWYQPITIALLTIISGSFNNVSIYKPITSKRDNHEVYVICFGYKDKPKVIKIFMDIIRTKQMNMPIKFNGSINEQLLEFGKNIFDVQSEKINLNIEQFKHNKINTKLCDFNNKLKQIIISDIQYWIRNIPIKQLDAQNKL